MIEQALKSNPEWIDPATASRQVTSALVPFTPPVPAVTGDVIASACIELIVREGEGTPNWTSMSHFAYFQQIVDELTIEHGKPAAFAPAWPTVENPAYVAADAPPGATVIDDPVALALGGPGETDDRAVYLDLTLVDGALRATADIELRAFRKGEPVAEPVTVGLQYFADEMVPGKVNSVSPLVVTACEVIEKPLGIVEAVEIPAGGRATVTLVADTAGCFKVRFLAPPMQADDAPQFAVEFFTCYRALPYDDYTRIPDEQVTWDYLYREVLSYYAVMYPVMSLIIPWGPTDTPTDPDRVVQFASLMREAVDASRIGTALQMPITRELSQGKRPLIQRWCDLQLR